MRLKKCKKCGNIFEASSPGIYMCHSCSIEIKRDSVLRERTCKSCGNSFVGGPRAWYCPTCRKERQNDLKRKRGGKTARPLGSIDICQICGNEYIVNSARQKYCPICADEAMKETVRIHKRQYMAENKEKMDPHKKEMRQNNWVCVICGNVFDKDNPTVTCSPECAKKLKKLRIDESEIRRGKRITPAGETYVSGLPKSGIVGVTYHRNSGKWQATYKREYIGVYDTVEKAVKAIENHKKNHENLSGKE